MVPKPKPKGKATRARGASKAPAQGADSEWEEVERFVERYAGSRYAGWVIDGLAQGWVKQVPTAVPDRWAALALITAGRAYLAGNVNPTPTRDRIEAAHAALLGTKPALKATKVGLEHVARSTLMQIKICGSDRALLEARAGFLLRWFSEQRPRFACVDAAWLADMLSRYTPQRARGRLTLDVIVASLCMKAGVFGLTPKSDGDTARKFVARACAAARKEIDG